MRSHPVFEDHDPYCPSESHTVMEGERCHVHPIPIHQRRYEAIEEEVVINRDALEQVAGDEEASASMTSILSIL